MKLDRRALSRDVTAGTTLGLVSVPDGLAQGLLAGLNPLAGLYGYMVGTLAGALTTSSVFMCVQATGAMSVVISDVPQVRGQPDSAGALATLGLLTGAIMVIAGVLRLGSMIRFVPNAVLTGFINAVGVNIILAQLADATGYDSDQGNRVVRLIDTALHPRGWSIQVLVAALVTLAVILLLERTRIGPLALVAGVVVTSTLVGVLHLSEVPLVRDITEIPQSLPGLQAPALSHVFDLLIPAFALAFVGLIQGAAISQSVPNPDGRYPDSSGDFRGQGMANIAAALLRGMPVGGSMSGTALVRTAGATGRIANIVAAGVMAAVILLFGGLAGLIAMPSLAALLMLVGFRTLKPDQMRTVWQTGPTQATTMTLTFVLTLSIPLQYAVVAGVAMAILLFVVRQSNKVKVKRWIFREGSAFPVEEPVPDVLPGGEVVVLAVSGSLFFASAQIVENQLPDVGPDSAGAVVVLRLRGPEDLGSTFIQTMLRYAAKLRREHCALVVAGVGQRVLDQLERTGALAELGPENVFPASAQVGEALGSALERARELSG